MAEGLRISKTQISPGCLRDCVPTNQKCRKGNKMTFYELCFEMHKRGHNAKERKLGVLYPIPKTEDWCYNLNNVRPILLLEAFRKTVVRIVLNRLVEVIKEKNILKGRNFAGLLEEGTAAPIHLINCLLENAKERKQEIWVLFQDMKKAFDSVGLNMLELAMQRIKIPKITINFILNLFRN